MSTARHWHGRRLLAVWFIVPVAVGLLRVALVVGTYQGTIADGRVTQVTGLWTPAFASAVTGMAAVVGVVILAVVTAMWVAGRKERARRRAYETQAHRKVLM